MWRPGLPLLTLILCQAGLGSARLHCPGRLSSWLLRPTTVDAEGKVLGTCYHLSEDEANWNAAQSACEAMSYVDWLHGPIDVRLASVHSLYENVYVFDNVTSRSRTWLGLHWENSEGDWAWDGAEGVNFQLWGTGSAPVDDSQGGCVSQESGLNSPCGEWQPADCDVPLRYVCETRALTLP